MSILVDIRPNSSEPLLVTPDKVGMIQHFYLDLGLNPPQPTVAFHDRHKGQQLWRDRDAAKLNVHTIVKELEKAGTYLLELPLITSEYGEYGAVHINPHAFLALTASAPNPQYAQTQEETIDVLLDVAGFGRVESHMVPVRLVNDFMTAIARVKPSLMTIFPDVAQSRFCNPGYATLDTDKIVCMRSNHVNLDVILQDDDISGARVDFEINADDDTDEAVIIAAREKLGDEIASRNPNLIKIKGHNEVHYAAVAQISSLRADKNILHVRFRSAERHVEDNLIVRFKTANDACAEALRLKNILSTGPLPTPKPLGLVL